MKRSKDFVISLLLIVFALGGYLYYTDRLSFETSTIQEVKSFAGDQIRQISVDTSSSFVEIKPVDGNEVHIRLDGDVSKHVKDRIHLEASVEGNQLKVGVEKKNEMFVGVVLTDLRLHIEVPKKSYDLLQVETSSGNVVINNVESHKVITSTSSGNIICKQMTGDDLRFTTSSGDQTLEQIKGKVKAETSSGKITLEMSEISHDVDVSTSSGTVNMQIGRLPETGMFTLETSSGDIRGDLPQYAIERKEEHIWRAKKGQGGPTVIINTSSGDIDLKN